MAMLAEELLRLVKTRSGHFVMESGLHSDHWCELDRMFDDEAALAPFVSELARRMRSYRPEIVVGPESGGARLARLVAQALGVGSVAATRVLPTGAHGLFPVRYQVTTVDRPRLLGRRVAIVDDAISAGSAVRGTLKDVLQWGAQPVVVGALWIFGDAAGPWAKDHALPLEAVARRSLGMWKPGDCPLCRTGSAAELVGLER